MLQLNVHRLMCVISNLAICCFCRRTGGTRFTPDQTPRRDGTWPSIGGTVLRATRLWAGRSSGAGMQLGHINSMEADSKPCYELILPGYLRLHTPRVCTDAPVINFIHVHVKRKTFWHPPKLKTPPTHTHTAVPADHSAHNCRLQRSTDSE